jgi:hypothetical protein
MFTKAICVYSALISVNIVTSKRLTCIYHCALKNLKQLNHFYNKESKAVNVVHLEEKKMAK